MSDKFALTKENGRETDMHFDDIEGKFIGFSPLIQVIQFEYSLI